MRLQRSLDHPKGVLQTAPITATGVGAWSPVFDVDAFGRARGNSCTLHQVSKLCTPPAYERCLLSLHEEGGDEAELIEFDLKAASLVPGGFHVPKSRNATSWLDSDTLLLTHTLDEAPQTQAGWGARAFVWKRGMPLSEAKPVLDISAQSTMVLPITAGGRGVGVLAEVVNYSTVHFHRVDASGKVAKIASPEHVKMAFGASHVHLFVSLSESLQTTRGSIPADSIVAIPIGVRDDDADRVEVVHRAGPAGFVDCQLEIPVAADSVALRVRSGLSIHIEVARRDVQGRERRPLIAPEPGVSRRIVGASPLDDSFIVMSEGFLLEPRQDLLRPGSERITLSSAPARNGYETVQVEVLEATSRDGEQVDFFRVGPKHRPSGPIPTLMTGYGAFGISLDPAHYLSPAGALYGGATLKLWLDRGGALVVPAIRGGGERGSAWHRSAMRHSRQRSYDDFHAVAQALVSSGFTSRDRLGVFGLSNGGLLAAVAGTQRPDLYGAIVSDVPLADMLRFPHMGMGAAWIDEYGDPARPEDAEILATYSPVQNVRPRVAYPLFLITVATSDNRVGPGHARKLAMRLQQAGAKFLLLESEDGGHGVSDALSMPLLMAMRMAFLADTLRLAA